MKIHFHLPRGYEADVTKAREDDDFDGWIDRKFGTRIRELISDDFTIAAGIDHFVIDFTYGDDAYAFTKIIGGKIIDQN